MEFLNEALNILTLGLVGVGAYLLVAAKAAVKTAAEEGARAAVARIQWPAELARELQKTRGVERQELRYRSYGRLWGRL
jgi:hypothetical protein